MKRLAPLCLLTLWLLAPGCADDPRQGWVWGDLYAQDVETVAVEMFTLSDQVYRRGHEMQLTEAVAKHIQADTPYRLATRAKADTLLTGQVELITQRILSPNPDTGRPRELELTYHVSFRWLDLRTGLVRKEVRTLPMAVSYVSHEPIDESFNQASMTVMDQLGDRIVESLQRDWQPMAQLPPPALVEPQPPVGEAPATEPE